MRRRQRRVNNSKGEAPGHPFTGRAPFFCDVSAPCFSTGPIAQIASEGSPCEPLEFVGVFLLSWRFRLPGLVARLEQTFQNPGEASDLKPDCQDILTNEQRLFAALLPACRTPQLPGPTRRQQRMCPQAADIAHRLQEFDAFGSVRHLIHQLLNAGNDLVGVGACVIQALHEIREDLIGFGANLVNLPHQVRFREFAQPLHEEVPSCAVPHNPAGSGKSLNSGELIARRGAPPVTRH